MLLSFPGSFLLSRRSIGPLSIFTFLWFWFLIFLLFLHETSFAGRILQARFHFLTLLLTRRHLKCTIVKEEFNLSCPKGECPCDGSRGCFESDFLRWDLESACHTLGQTRPNNPSLLNCRS